MRESEDRQVVGQMEEMEVEEVSAEQSARGQLGDKGIGAGGDVEEVIGETLRPSINISNNDFDQNLRQECFTVMSKSDSKLICIKPAQDTSKDI